MRFMCFGLLWLLQAILFPTSGLAVEPTVIQSWGTPGPESGQLDNLQDIAVDQDYVFLVDRNRLQRFSPAGEFHYKVNRGATDWLDEPRGVDVGPDGTVFVLEGGGNRVQRFARDGTSLGEWPQLLGPLSIRAHPDGIVSIAAFFGEVLDRYDALGEPRSRFQGEEFRCIADDAEGFYYTIDRDEWVGKYSPESEKLISREYPYLDLGHCQRIMVSSTGVLYAIFGTRILIFNDEWEYMTQWDGFGWVTGIDEGPNGDIWVSDMGRHQVLRLEPEARTNPIPEDSAVFLHIAAVAATGCDGAPSAAGEIRTSANASPDGDRYFVYLLGSPRKTDDGLLGVQCGVEYPVQPAGQGVQILGWQSCADQEWRDDEWPGSGAGNTLTWLRCQTSTLVVAGYLYVAAYGPSTLSVIGFPHNTQAVKTANCRGAEDVSDQFLPQDRVGWVSLGGGGLGGTTAGCNPLLTPCTRDLTPVRPITWGKLKSHYRD